MAVGLLHRIQQHTTSNVTDNFVKTLQNLAKAHAHDVNMFIKACMALGRFKGQEDFLAKLHAEFCQNVNGGPKTSQLRVAGEGSQADVAMPAPPRFRKLKTNGLNFDDEYFEDEDTDEQGLNNTLAPEKQPQRPSRFQFKKLSKDEAQKLRQYSEPVDKDLGGQLSKSTDMEIPNLVSYSNDLTHVENIKRDDDSEVLSLSDNESDGQILEEDREWYDNDGDYGHQALSLVEKNSDAKFKVSESFKRKERSSDKSQIHLSSMSMSQRKEFIPPFLYKYNSDPAYFASISTISGVQDSSTKRLIDPIRNAESEFSSNAKKGSTTVAMRRSKEVQKTKMQETSELSGTAIGEIMGIKEGQVSSNIQKPINQNQEHATAASFAEIQRMRKSLPAYKVRSELLQIIRDHQVVIIIGETGSGKTTQLAQFLKEDGYCNDGHLIGCTQPRRVAAMSVATRVALEVGVEIGDEVGYSIRFEDKTSWRTKIKFMTDGILLREFVTSKMLEKYNCIIMDEAHERSLSTDILFGIFKNLLSSRKDLKLIVTSATMNANRFSQFFGGAPMFTIPGRTHPVQIVFSRQPVSDYVESTILQASKLHLSNPIESGDILIFMTGQEDIEATCEGLKERLIDINSKKKNRNSADSELSDIEILPIYSALPADVQNKVFEPTPNKRKVVVATNIAETSLTIDGIKFVIDCGYVKLKVYNPQIGLDSLQIVPISMASANQRSGRAGRTGPGVAYRLFTEDSYFDDMYVQTIPEIQRTNLSNTILLLRHLGVRDLMAFPLIDPPPEQSIISSLFDLWTVGALDNFGALTKLGIQMASFPLQPSLSKMLLIASQSGCSEEMLTIVSMLSVPQVFYRPREREEESDQARTRFFVPESDHLTLLNVYAQWKANSYSAGWCKRNFLQYKSLQRAKSIRVQLSALMQKKSISIVSSGTDWDVIRKCICSGSADQAARLSGLNKYVQLRNGLELRVHPASALFGAGDLPSYVVYHEMLLTSNEYINVVTAVDPLWLMNYGVVYYNASRRVDEEEDVGLYAAESKQHLKDEVDVSIEQAMMKKELIKRRLLKDAKSIQDNNGLDDAKGQNESITKKPGAKIGFKRRRPF
ncbi:LADA_0A01156g1_1 [Lachancea dasiensis]|uniref:Pre-mRNA-splicing factor ATP-dependent RNA helicase PRP16 n=1 Tax=Lachancea dasiensis TaxID=1072105 RepID=A0A1G4ILZ1_9SACH|nr:LADA_0A01156g1_1 [Lachancea dasiensis]